MGSGLSTMPSPPPKGRSSTVRWRSCVKLRRSCVATRDQVRLDGTMQDAVLERAGEEVGEDGDDIEVHRWLLAARGAVQVE